MPATEQTMHQRQSGFTLIELMVVVVIIAVVVSVGVMSLGSSEQATLRSQERSVKALLLYVRDQAAFNQQLYLVEVNEKGLSAYRLRQNRWQADETTKPLKWDEALTVDWKIGSFQTQDGLLNQTGQDMDGREGWLFWPSGEVIPGEIHFAPLQSDVSSQNRTDNKQRGLRWNELLQFEALDEDK